MSQPRNIRAVEMEPCRCPVCRECRRGKGDRYACIMVGPYSGDVEEKGEEAPKQ